MLTVGLVGLPNAGKSSLFNLLTKRTVPAQNFPFTTIDPNDGIVEVKDLRVDTLSKMVSAQKSIYTAIEFRDIAGLIKNAHAGEGLGNQFLSHIRECDLILMVIRKFEDDTIIHVENRINPDEDKEILMIELTMADKKLLESAMLRLKKDGAKDPKLAEKITILQQIIDTIDKNLPASTVSKSTDTDIISWRKSLNLLTDKEIVLLGNISKDKANVDFNTDFDIDVLLESELESMSAEDRVMFGANEITPLDQLITTCYNKLNLSTFLTAGEKEVRAWTFQNGWKAPQCAAVIHTDFEKKFIKAEVISYEDYVSLGGEKGAAEKGKKRIEGKEYVMKDGDVVEYIIN
jgi:ribosome-binding ATPase